MSLTVGSLFAGIGGIELGLERAGMEVAWQVEKDDYCRKVLAKHWPDVERFEDVREVGAENLEPVELICGGFPCQDISVAGKGEGIEGERSGLWSEMWRILRELRPRYALVENVPALRSRGLGRLLGDLAEIGYDAEWDCLPAAAFGAPHRRDRLFLVAYPRGGGREGRDGEPEPVERSEGAADAGTDGEARAVAYAGRDGRQRIHEQHRILRATAKQEDTADGGSTARWRHSGERTAWKAEPDVGRVADGVPSRVDRLRALGNAVVPQVAEWIGRRIVEHAEPA